jgi:hypothetical protein
VAEASHVIAAPATAVDLTGVRMNDRGSDKPGLTIPFAPQRRSAPEGSPVLDDPGNAIIEMLHRAAEQTKEECARAMDTAHRLSFELRQAEERARLAEAEAQHFRDRAAKAEAWLLRIHGEIDQSFFQKKERPSPPSQLPSQPPARDPYAPPSQRGKPNGGGRRD